jgi:hypothetical protein
LFIEGEVNMGVVGRKVIDTQNMKSSLYGFGINDADYPIKTRVDGKCVIVPEYSRWISVVQRSNDPKEKARKPHYEDVYCSEKWKYFTDFSTWLHTQPYWRVLALDKDILIKGNKEYGPDTCCFVPQYLNGLLYTKSKTGQFLIGVSLTKSGKYSSEPWFRTDVADSLMSRVWDLRLHAATGVITMTL